MNFRDYRIVFQVGSLALLLLAASPALSLISFSRGRETFSELWLLDRNRMTENFPFNVHVGLENSLFLCVGNHLGHSGYYMVLVKFGNQTQALPSSNSSEPSSLPSIHEFRFLLEDGEIWELPIIFEVLETSVAGSTLIAESVSVNDRAFEVNSSSSWDLENAGYFFQLLFELYVYDSEGASLQFHDRFVRIWLNIAG